MQILGSRSGLRAWDSALWCWCCRTPGHCLSSELGNECSDGFWLWRSLLHHSDAEPLRSQEVQCFSGRLEQQHPTPVLLPGKSHGQRNLGGCSPWGHYELDTTERLHFHFSLSCIGEGNGNPLQYSCLENPRDGGGWWAAVYGVAQSRTRLKWLSSSSSSSTSPLELHTLCSGRVNTTVCNGQVFTQSHFFENLWR